MNSAVFCIVQLYLMSLTPAEVDLCSKSLIQLLFFPAGGLSQARFFSYSEVEDAISLVLDKKALDRLEAVKDFRKGARSEHEPWRLVTLLN